MKRIEEIIELIEITGDKCIILHKEKTSAYVVMKLEDYKNFYKNRLKKPEKEESSFTEVPELKSNNLIRPIPHKPVDVKEFEIKRQKQEDFNEDVYYPEPLIE